MRQKVVKTEMNLTRLKASTKGTYRDWAMQLLTEHGIISDGERSSLASKRILDVTNALLNLNDTTSLRFQKGQELVLPKDFVSFYAELTRPGTAARRDTLGTVRQNARMTFDGTAPNQHAIGPTFDRSSIRADIVAAAQRYVGMREQGYNRGEVDMFRWSALDATQTPVPEGSPYCALFAGTVLQNVLGFNPLGGTASTREAVKIAETAGAYHAATSYAPKPGDIAYLREGRGGHVALVKEVLPDGSLVLIEGNVGRGANAGVHETVLNEHLGEKRGLAGFVDIGRLVASATQTNLRGPESKLAKVDGYQPLHVM